MALGFDVGTADGVLGPQTTKAIALFQVAVGDAADGRASETLRAKLQKALAERNPGNAPRQRQATEVVGSGSGFYIGRNTIVTNHHVIDGCSEIRLRKSGAEISSAHVVAVSKGDDLAALHSNKPSDSSLGLRVGVPLKPAEAIVVFGYPLMGALSSTGNTTLGNITALSGLQDDSRYIQISASIQPGNSGGPVVDEAGRLIGVVQSKLNALKVVKAIGDIPQNVNFAIRSSTLANFLEANQIPYEAALNSSTLPNTRIAELASAATVQLECRK